MILDGLSNRLVNFEKSSKLNATINLEPRTKYPLPTEDAVAGISKPDLDQYK